MAEALFGDPLNPELKPRYTVVLMPQGSHLGNKILFGFGNLTAGRVWGLGFRGSGFRGLGV